jgi:hypothetical protein
MRSWEADLRGGGAPEHAQSNVSESRNFDRLSPCDSIIHVGGVGADLGEAREVEWDSEKIESIAESIEHELETRHDRL